MRKTPKLFLTLLLFAFSLNLSAQRYVSGQITDAGDGAPIPGVSVFISNTTVGMITDADGRYRLAIPGEGSYRLAAVHAAYQPVFTDIEPGKKTVVKDIKMQNHELKEVAIVKKVKFRYEDIDLFWKTIPSRR